MQPPGYQCHHVLRQGLHLEPSQFQVAVKWWLGLDTSGDAQCALCPEKSLDPLGHHATTCKRGGDVVAITGFGTLWPSPVAVPILVSI